MIDCNGYGTVSGRHVHVDLDTLATALYVRIDDEMKVSPQLNRWRPAVGGADAPGRSIVSRLPSRVRCRSAIVRKLCHPTDPHGARDPGSAIRSATVSLYPGRAGYSRPVHRRP